MHVVVASQRHLSQPRCNKTPVRMSRRCLQQLWANGFLSRQRISAAFSTAVTTSSESSPATTSPLDAPKLSPSIDLTLPPTNRARSLADLANNVPLLSRLMSMGVDLSKADRLPGVGPMLLSLDYESDAKPRFKLLMEYGCLPREAAEIVSGFPAVLVTPIPALRDRLAYFQRAGFARLPELLRRQPTVLTMTPESVDGRLSRLQRLYEFSNDQLILVSTECPKVFTFHMEHMAAVRTCLAKGLQLGLGAARKMAVLHPPLMVSELSRLYRNFALLTGGPHKLPSDLIVSNPLALTKQPQRVAARLKFLTELGRAQFDPQLPLYTSLTSAVSGSDAEFCNRVANCSPNKYRAFLKSI